MKSTDSSPSTQVSVHIPETFQPADWLPPNLLVHSQSCWHLMHTVLRRMMHNGKKFAPLKRDFIRADLGRDVADKVLRAMIDEQEIHPVKNRSKVTMGYRPSDKYAHTPLRRVTLSDPRLIDRVMRARKKQEEHRQAENASRWRPVHDKWEQWQEELTVDWDHAEELLEAYKHTEKASRIKIEERKWIALHRLQLRQIQQRRFRFIVDRYGRVHNSLTSVAGFFRPCLRMWGEPLSWLDIKNSQPTFLLLVMRDQKPLQLAKRIDAPMVPCAGGPGRSPDPSHHLHHGLAPIPFNEA